jgi:hypothetical protein
MDNMFDGATSFNQNLGAWDVSGVQASLTLAMAEMLKDSGLSVSNYSATLSGWASLTSLNPGIILGADPLKYSSAAVSARNVLTSGPNNWVITDGGQE